MAGEHDDLTGMNWVLRHPSPSSEHLQRLWPDIAQQLGAVTEGVDDAIVSLGPDWTATEQLNHFTDLRTHLDHLAADLDGLAGNWDSDQW